MTQEGTLLPTKLLNNGKNLVGVSVNLNGFVLNKVALEFPIDVTFDVWHDMGSFLSQAERSRQWWIGDWLNYGEARFGEMYSQAIGATSFAYQTLANWAWVARAIPVQRRRWQLDFSHHAVVAKLPPEDQEQWLDKAERDGMTESELRLAVRNAYLVPEPEQPQEESAATETEPDPPTDIRRPPYLGPVAAAAITSLRTQVDHGLVSPELDHDQAAAMLVWVDEVLNYIG